MLKNSYLFIVCALIAILSYSQEAYTQDCTVSPCDLELDCTYFKNYLHDGVGLLTMPAQWKPYQWGIAAGSVLLVGGMVFVDERIRQSVQENRNSYTDGVSMVFGELGEGLVVAPGLVVLYGVGMLTKDCTIKETALHGCQSLVFSAVVTQMFKSGFHRHRPYSGDGAYRVDGPGISLEDLSFVSGHSSTAFSIATIVSEEYRDNPVIPVVAYTCAVLTALSRINDDEHWASDVLAGAIVGHVIARGVYELHHRNKNVSIGMNGVSGVKMTVVF